MTRVKISGSWLTEENEIRGGVVNEFKVLLSAAGGWRPNTSGLSFARLEVVEAARLEEVFSEEEIFSALSDLNGDVKREKRENP